MKCRDYATNLPYTKEELLMNNRLQEKLALFAENNQRIRSDFVWQDGMAKRLVASVYAMGNHTLDSDAIRDCHKMIKDEVGIFSSFRGNLSLYIAAALSLHEQPEQLLSDMIQVYKLLKEEKFRSSDFLAATVFEITTNAKSENFTQIVNETKEFFDGMKASHRLRVGGDDYIFAAMLALSDVSLHTGIEKLNHLYSQLRSEFGITTSGSSILALSQMLVLGESTDECVRNTLQLNEALQERKVRLDRTYVLPSLGVLGLLPIDKDVIINDLIAARDYLRDQKGFGALMVSTQELLLYAVSFVADSHKCDLENSTTKANITTNIANLIVAQQVAMMVAIIAASTAAASS